MEYTLHRGDCLAVLRTMADASVDAIVTDPPYGLTSDGGGPSSKGQDGPYGRARAGAARGGFMGMKWDSGVPSVEIWAECLRVLKPGGHLLAFAGTRTQHRMAVNIEDAGFEIRDMIAWVYASGFPKSHNLDNLRGDKICGCAEPYTQNGAEQKTECDLRSMRGADVSAAINHCAERGEILQQGLQEQSTSTAGRTQLPAAEAGGGQSGMEGRRDASQAPGELCAGAVHPCAGVGGSDGPQGRLRDGAPADNGSVVRLPADTDGSRAPRGPQPAAQRSQEPGALAGQSKPQAVGAWPVCGGCGLPVVPRGLGTALKPALEPITVARKPLAGTVAANVLQHGTGALNIEGCRVPGVPEAPGSTPATVNGNGRTLGAMTRASYAVPTGRWPANLIHDGSDEVLAGFPDSTSGAMKAGTMRAAQEGPGSVCYGTFGGNFTSEDIPASTGSAARFFYCAKASRADRNAGTDAPPQRAGGMVSNTSGQHMTRRDGYEPPQVGNFHPTVKPTDLMAYLVRLVTPPGGLVLDPFMGSGSTGKACMREGFRFIGIDLDDDGEGNPLGYVEIARARIEHERQRVQQAPPPAPQQLDLLQALA